MGKSTKKKNKKITAPKANIQELSISRDGGQIALRGYSYQFLYSCYLILSSSNPSNFFQLEGIEDIDCIMQKNGSNDITHIQLKYSVNKQDASFLTDVLKNFLEAYLLDQNRFFKLVYDFPVAKGHLSKIFASKLDEKSRTHWAGVISNIKKNNPSWNWSVYDFDKFISHLSFEKIEKSILATEIEKTLIRIYEINTDNVSLFANSIKILCFEKMEQRAYVTKAELDSKIQSVKIDISKGPQNPAHSWIRKLDYSKPSIDEGCSFYEGKKATPADIVSGFPIKRPSLEKDVINSICENMVTVIKASSGQGKTTLALRAAYILQSVKVDRSTTVHAAVNFGAINDLLTICIYNTRGSSRVGVDEVAVLVSFITRTLLVSVTKRSLDNIKCRTNLSGSLKLGFTFLVGCLDCGFNFVYGYGI